jgi:tetratricopeptide (TPR) repeat protein
MLTLRISFRTLGLLAIPVVLSFSPAFAQRGTNPGGGGGGNTNGPSTTPGSTGRPSNGTPNNNNTGLYTPSPLSTPSQSIPRPIFLSGRVMLDDGAKPTSEIAIQRVCNGNPHTETHTDSKGHFSFQLGGNNGQIADASESSVGMGPMQRQGRGGYLNGMGDTNMPGMRGLDNNYWQRCQIQAYYPGYRSDTIDLFQHRALDNPDIGVIILHRLGGIQGTAISITTELAPKKAKKDFHKAEQLQAKGKTDDAMKHLQEAVSIYPKYAIAWYDLGQLQQSQKNLADARKSYEAALAADSKYVNPYDGLAALSVMESKWQDAADRSKQAVSLNPVEFPSSWLYNAYANYNLKNFKAAEKSAGEVVKLDGAHRYAQVETLLAQMCADHGDYAGAAQHLQTFLQLRPNAQNVDKLKQELAKLQAMVAQMKK